jgi:hypothetical protein
MTEAEHIEFVVRTVLGVIIKWCLVGLAIYVAGVVVWAFLEQRREDKPFRVSVWELARQHPWVTVLLTGVGYFVVVHVLSAVPR